MTDSVRKTEMNDHDYMDYPCNHEEHTELVYIMSRKEVAEFVKLRVSNNCLFSGRRYTSRLAWSAILKHMGLHDKMSAAQASKKWENLKKKYKAVKYPPEGVKVFPELWAHFTLMDDALEGRLVGSAPVVKALPFNKDDPDFFKPRKRYRASKGSSPPRALMKRPENEVLLNGDEAGTEEQRSGGTDVQRIMQEVDDETNAMFKERQLMEREREVLQRERAGLDRELAMLERERASLERERAMVERERAALEREKAMVEKERDGVCRERRALERERGRLERLRGGKEGVDPVGDAQDGGVDTKERLLCLLERMIESI